MPVSESIARNAGFVLTMQVASAAMTAVLTIYLARTLGPADFGVFSLALGLEGILLLPADFGISQSCARFLAERRGDPDAVAGILRTAVRVKVVVSAAICIALAASAGLIANIYEEPDLVWAIRGIAVSMFGHSFLQLFGSAFTAQGLSSKLVLPTMTESTVELGASVALVALGGGAAGAAFGRGIGYAVGAAVFAILAARHIGWASRRARKSAVGPRRIFAYGAALVVIDGAYSVFDQIDVILVGALLTTTAAGLFQGPLRLLRFLSYPGNAVGTAIAPRVARHQTLGPNLPAFVAGLRYMLIFQMTVAVVVVVWADPIVGITLGPDFAESAEVMRALAPYVLLMGIGPLATLSINYLGGARRRMPIAVGALVINMIVDVVLIPKIGIVAGAIGTDIAFAFYVPAHLYLCTRFLDVSLRPLLLTLLRVAAGGAAMAGTLAAFGTSADVGVPRLLVGGLAGMAVYLAVLFLSRELSLRDLREIRAAFI